MALDIITQFHLEHGARQNGYGKTIEQQLAEQGLRQAEPHEHDAWAMIVWNNDTGLTGRVWVVAADLPSVSCDLCTAPALCEYGEGQLCKDHYEAALKIEREQTILAVLPPCLVCGEPAITEWAGDDPYCSIHLDELLALDTTDTPRTYAVTGTIQWGESRIKTSTNIAAHSKLEAARLVLASVVLPWRASWADVYVVAQ